MEKAINIIQIIISVFLVIMVLIQSKSGGLSDVFGGGGATIYKTKRGAEKFIFWSTIILSIAFLGLAFYRLFI